MPTVAPPPPPAESVKASLPQHDQQLIDQQIQKTRRGLKSVDLTAGMITLVIGVLLFLLTAAILDHWIVPGGLGTWGRSLLFVGFLAGLGWHLWRSFLPLLRPINPIYAAHTIESNSPSLKNSLLSLLLFRGRKQPMAAQVYQAIQKQTADRLNESPMASVIDRSSVIRLGYILVAVVALCALYRVFSPKNPTTTVGRVLAPWADIAAPSRVQIVDISPGDTSVARGERLDVSAEILGLAEEETVELHYSSLDKQIVDSQLLMTRQGETSLYTISLPAKRRGVESGIQQDLLYWITAGDARSKEHEIKVYSRPTIVVTGVRYDYPAYTGFPTQTVPDTGDIRGVEGTRVTISALSNLPLKSAHVDFAADGRRDLAMNVDGERASISFTLTLQEDRRTPKHKSYALRMTSTEGRENNDPAKYRIEVTPDYAPEVRLLTPEELEIEVRSDETVRIEAEARDPDFAVSQVSLVGLAGEREVSIGRLLDEDFSGKFTGGLAFTPESAGLKPGDVLEYWATARDNRRPEANLGVSEHRRMKIVGPAERPDIPNQDQQPQNPEEQNGEGEQNQEGGEGGAEGQEGAGGEGGEAGENDPEAGGEGQPGEGGEGNQENQAQAGEGGEGQQPNDGQPGEAQPNGMNEQGDNQPQEGQQEGGQQQNQPNGNRSEGGEQGEQNQDPVASDGSDDGEAFDRIANHLNEQEGQQDNAETGENGEQQPAQPDGAGQSQEAQSQEGQSGEGEQAQPQPGEAQQENSGQPQGEQTGEGQQPKGEAGQQQDGTQPDAAQPKPDSEMENENSGEASEGPDSDSSRNQGESGSGENPGEEQGTPEANAKQSREKDNQAEGQEAGSEEPSESRDKQESDTESSQSGDRSGEGQEGAGQQADDQGKGGAGENTAADEGANAANEPGEGETGEQAGDGAAADQQTGESSGEQAGEGSEQEQGQGNQPGGETGQNQGPEGEQPEGNQPRQGEGPQGIPPAGEPPQGEPSQDQQQSDNEQSPEGNPGQPGNPNSNPQGGDAAQGSTGDGPPPEGEAEPGDAANLDFAKQQTDLVLEKLEDQLAKKKVDEEMLDKLGWDEVELRRFVDRWKNLKERAAGPGDDAGEAATELNEALRSLGLGNNGPKRFKSNIDKDKLRNLNEAYRNQAPLKYRDRVRAYVKGAAGEK